MVIDNHETLATNYVVLAKYMRVLTPTFVHHYLNQIINIHHSFLPALISARPYHQANELVGEEHWRYRALR
ncbi:MAG: Formyltetrahydrofolate deformylase [Sodalis sp.]|nr:MAG: Formyltetrahydrofolate deformylase [Sodalis sp.]